MEVWSEQTEVLIVTDTSKKLLLKLCIKRLKLLQSINFLNESIESIP